MKPLVRDVMRLNPVCIKGGATLVHATEVIRDTRAAEVVVIEGESATGIVSGVDIRLGLLADRSRGSDRLLRELIEGAAATVTADLSVAAVRRPMRERQVDKVVVCSRDGVPVGIVTLADLEGAAEPEPATLATSAADPVTRLLSIVTPIPATE